MPDPAATTITNIILGGPVGGRYLRGKHPAGDKAETTGCPRRWRRPSTRRTCWPRRSGVTAPTRRSTSPPSSTGARRGVVYARAAVRDGELYGHAFDALRRKLGPGPCLSGGGPSSTRPASPWGSPRRLGRRRW